MTYSPRTTARPHQAEALRRMAGKKGFALLMAMRCVDGDTEYLSPTGWKKISTYTGGLVAEFRLDGTAQFVQPLAYIKSLVDKFWHFYTQGGVDQVLSHHHRILTCARARSTWGVKIGPVPEGFRSAPRSATDYWRETSPAEIHARPALRRHGHKKHIPVCFNLHTNTKLDLSNDQIRLMVAFHADGSYGQRDLAGITPIRNGFIRIKKARKKTRLRMLLKRAGVLWQEKHIEDNFSLFIFRPPWVSKTYGEIWWSANFAQRKLIAEEVVHWDGRVMVHRSDAGYYSSIHECDADFIQFCFTSTGQRASCKPRGGDGTFGVQATGTGRTNNLAMLPYPESYTSKHDGFMYSFAVPSTYLVLRRNGKVFCTGNTGKSKVIIDEWGAAVAAGELDDLLIIAPAGSYRGWDLDKGPGQPSELRKHMNPALFKQACVVAWESRSQTSKRACQALLDVRLSRVLLMNIEALSAVEAAFKLCEKFLSQRRAMMVVDESTVLRNPGSIRTKRVLKLGPLAKQRRILTGLVAPKSPLDLWGQFAFLDWRILGHLSFATFRARYAIIERVCMLPTEALRERLMRVTGGDWYDLGRQGLLEELERRRIYIQQVPLIKGYRHEDELRDKIKDWSYRITLDDVREASPPVYEIRDVAMPAEQRRVYDEIKEKCTVQLASGTHVTATSVIAQMKRLHQVICGHVGDELGDLQVVPERRIAAILEILSEYDGKAIIWCAYDYNVRQVADALKKEYGEESTARFWGGNRSTREAEEAQFKGDAHCRFMVATAAAGGRGRTWSVADLVIYHSNDFDLEHRSQSEERTEGIEKLINSTRVDLMARGTIDEKIVQALRAKLDMATLINGDNYKEWLI